MVIIECLKFGILFILFKELDSRFRGNDKVLGCIIRYEAGAT